MEHLTQIKERVSAEKEIPTYKYHYKKWVFNEWLKKENIKVKNNKNKTKHYDDNSF